MSKSIALRALVSGVLATGPVCVGHAQDLQPRRLVEVVDIAGPVMSPDGRRVAFRAEQASVERNTYGSTWYVQALDEASPKPIAEGGVPLRDSAGSSLPPTAVWSPDGRWIYYRALVDGAIEVWRAAVDGSGAAPLTHDAADVRDFTLDQDGRTLRYSVGATREQVQVAEQAEYDQGIRIDETVPIGQGLFRSGNVQGRMATQRFGKVWFDRGPLLAEVPDQWIALDLTTGAKRALTGSQIRSSPLPDESTTHEKRVDGDPWKSVRRPHGDSIALLTRIGDGGGQMYRPQVLLSVLPSARARKAIECDSELCTGKAITAMQWRPGLNEVLFTVTDPDVGLAQSIYRWKIGTGQVNAVVRSRGLINGGREVSSACGASTDALVCVTAEADRPPRLESIDLALGERRVLFDPNAALAQAIARNVPARLLGWVDAQGRHFTGQFYSAQRGGGPVPLFVTYYSCPGFVRGGVGDEWPLTSLAQAGISALCINQLPGYTMDAVERHGQGMAAVESAIDLLSSQGRIDRARVGMGGLSFGGAVTMWTATHSDLLAAASVSNPVVSPNYYLLASMMGERFLTGLRDMWGLQAPNQTPERWKAISPMFRLDRVRAPILFQHSEQEYMYALDYAIPLLREQRADMYVFPNEPHQKFQPRHKLAVYERNLDWFRFWLQGCEDPDPLKRAQYLRWHVMKAAAARQKPGSECKTAL